MFTKDRVFLSWNPPSISGRCCKNYVVKEVGKANFANTIPGISTTSLSRELSNHLKYTVYCKDTADLLSPPSIPLHIHPGN